MYNMTLRSCDGQDEASESHIVSYRASVEHAIFL